MVETKESIISEETAEPKPDPKDLVRIENFRGMDWDVPV